MHSGNSEKAASLRKRTLSRGMSEDESLRHIIREAEESNKYLSRHDSRCGLLKQRQRQESLGEADLRTEKIEMVELQADYEVCLQEIRTLELQQEAVLFQVDCLQDALEGAEEMLSETRREAHTVTMELERERDARRKLEDIVSSLMLEMEVLRKERNSVSVVPVNDVVGVQAQEVRQVFDNYAVVLGTSVDGDVSSEGMSMVSQCPASTEEPALTSSRAALGFTSGQTDASWAKHAGPIWLQGAPEGTSVDQEASLISDTESSELNLNRSLALQLEGMIEQTVHCNEKRAAHGGDDNDESSGYEDAPSEFSPTPSTPEVETDGDLQEGEVYASDKESNSDSCALS